MLENEEWNGKRKNERDILRDLVKNKAKLCSEFTVFIKIRALSLGKKVEVRMFLTFDTFCLMQFAVETMTSDVINVFIKNQHRNVS